MELLVVIAIIALLLALLLPTIAAARERAAVVKALAELKQISDALEGYGMENQGRFPPGRTYCDIEKRDHWCDLPKELVTFHWLPDGRKGTFLSSVVEDVFNAGHTYKYIAPGWGFHNNAVSRLVVWVPDAFPKDSRTADPNELPGDYYDNVRVPKDPATGVLIPCPVSWVVWSLGPRYNAEEGSPPNAPIPRYSWYRGFGTRGVIPFIRTREGELIGWQ